MSLVLEIEYLMGVAFAAQGPDSSLPDWPPQPDRVFSALVATWGAHGEEEGEASALRWLEELPLPAIFASGSEPRMAPLSYVPPNDPRSGRSGDRTVIPLYRRRQPRRFAAARPHEPVVQLFWKDAEPAEKTVQALQSLAVDTSYVGHSASLTRCRFYAGSACLRSALQQRHTKRRIYPGRLSELREDYARSFSSNGKVGRPKPGDIVFVATPLTAELAHSCFDSRWLILQDVGEEPDYRIPDIRAAALIAKEIRDTLLSGYREQNMGDSIPGVVSGHEPDGSPAKEPHIAIVPLAFAGYEFADGHLLGFALVPPHNSKILADSAFRAALRRIAPVDLATGRRTITLHKYRVQLSPTVAPQKRSLQPVGYLGPKCTFATITPIVLDRHLKDKGSDRHEEVVLQIEAACRNIGLPTPAAIFPDKYSAIEGAVPAHPSGNAPSWMRWRLPASLSSRPLVHAIIRFESPVMGPLLLGAGRFVGLGMCRPIADADAVDD